MPSGIILLSADTKTVVELGQVKNTNKNPVTERAIRELEEEILRVSPNLVATTLLNLATATARLNSCIRTLWPRPFYKGIISTP